MKITNQQSIEIFNALNELANEKVPAKLAWKIQMGRKALEENVKSLNVLIADIQLKYAIRDEKENLLREKMQMEMRWKIHFTFHLTEYMMSTRS
jgi:hypothetical protein